MNRRQEEWINLSPLLTHNQIAEYLGVKPSTIYQWTSQGYIPHVKLRRLVRFDLRVIEKWVQGLTQKGRGTRGIDITELGI